MAAVVAVDRLASAVAGTGELVSAVQADQWTASTPCAGWNTRALLTHLVLGDRLFTALLRGVDPTTAMGELQRFSGADVLGSDPAAVYRAGTDQLIAAFTAPGALDRTITVPVGTVAGSVAIHLRIVETLVHGWDLAAAIGRPARYPDSLVEPELSTTREMLADLLPPDLPLGQRPFGPPQPVSVDAPAIDRLAAVLGRSVGSPERHRPAGSW